MILITTFNAEVVTEGATKTPTKEEVEKVLAEELSYILDSDVRVENVETKYIEDGDNK